MKIRKLKSAEDVKKFLDSSKTEYVKVGLTDIDGILRGKYMHVDKFIKSTKKGFGFCDVIFGWDSSDELYELKNESVDDLYTGWHSGFPDAKANIIPESGEGMSQNTYKEKIFEWAYPEVAKWCKSEGRKYPELTEKGEIIDDLPRTEKMRY